MSVLCIGSDKKQVQKEVLLFVTLLTLKLSRYDYVGETCSTKSKMRDFNAKFKSANRKVKYQNGDTLG
jgi:hypothetical protein